MKQKGEFLSMLLGKLAASLLESALTRKGVIRAGEGVIRAGENFTSQKQTETLVKKEESIDILKIIVLINNIEEHNRIYDHV